MAELDARPAELDAYFRPGDPLTITATWPTDLSGRTFTAQLGVTAITITNPTSAVLTIAVPAATTALYTTSAAFILTETTGDDVVRFAGTWFASDKGTASPDIAVTTVVGDINVDVTVTGPPGPSGGGGGGGAVDSVVGQTGDVTASQILTGLLTVDGAGSGLDADLLDGQSSAAFQPVDSDLTAIAALTTTAFGRGLLTLADAAALLAASGGTDDTTVNNHIADTSDAHDASAISVLDTAAQFTATDVEAALAEVKVIADAAVTPAEAAAAYQPLDADLTSIAALTTTAFGRSLLEAANAAALRTLADVDQAGTDNSTNVTLVTTAANYLSITGQAITLGLINLASHVTGTLPEANGGSGGTVFATQVAATAAVTANTAKVTNATHTGDVTGATALTIADDAVTYAKMQNVTATDRLLGRDTAGAGVIEEIAPAAVRTMLNVEDGADVTDAANVATAGAVMESDTSTALMSFVVDEDTMTSNSATKLSTQQSIKAYVDNEITGLDEIAAGVRTTLDTGTPGFIGVDVDLASGVAGGDTLTGGTAASETLTLASTAHATRGTIDVRDMVRLITEDKTWTDANAKNLIQYGTSRTLSLGDAAAFNLGNLVQGILFNPTLSFAENGSALGAVTLFNAAPTVTNVGTRTVTNTIFFRSAPTYTAATDAVTLTSGAFSPNGPGHTGFMDIVTYGVTTTGTLAVTEHTAFSAIGPTVGTGVTVTTRRGLHITDAIVTGTLTTNIGIDIAKLNTGTTAIGIRNASMSVKTPIANANITATSATIRHDAALVTLTANASYTLASTPTLTDGVNGEELIILNVDTADTITLQDQGTLAGSNLRLAAATVALGPRDSIRLVYNSTIGDWVQIGQTNVI